jgi:hypothetical protein
MRNTAEKARQARAQKHPDASKYQQPEGQPRQLDEVE